ncbi:ricin-type beta-trefoil lectin domain protein [Actinoallomurus vinaceus]|uniref:ricin-type beta-trefoil lectin domain protein n=1 Tax=Actinoallomurus vinaceus TaxID=1080074 RepID=UPI0031E6F662
MSELGRSVRCSWAAWLIITGPFPRPVKGSAAVRMSAPPGSPGRIRRFRSGTRRSPAPRTARAFAAVTIAAMYLAIPRLSTGPALAADRPHSHTRTSATADLGRQTAQASARAKATGKPVKVEALTTATSATTATPQGTFVVTDTLQPTRIKRGGTWVDLDATLHRNSDGTVSPTATSTGLVLSGGGTGPLATMIDGGVRLSLSWPASLPTPTLNAASATYADVLPDVDLVVTATPQGGFSHVLVVKTKAAAANPALADLALQAHGEGVSVSADAHGYLSASTSPNGIPIFAAKTAVMWDSATNATPTTPVAPPDLPSAPGVSEPGPRAHIEAIKTTVTPTASAPTRTPTVRRMTQDTGGSDSTITLSPDAGMLSASSTVFPLFIDPTWNPAGGSRQAWASVSNALDATEYDNSFDPNANVLQVGHVNGFTSRSFIRFSVSSVLKGATVHSSDVKFTVDNDGDEYCHTSSETDLWWTGDISKSISWSNQPSWKSKVASTNADNCPNHSVDFDVTSFMQKNDTSGATDLTFGLRAPDESTDTQWEEFYSGNGEATMSTEYDRLPGLGRLPSTSPGGLCQTGSPSSMVIGNDGITFSVIPNDPDGKTNLTTKFVVKDYKGAVVFPTGAQTGTVDTASGTPARLPITSDQIKKWHTDGATTAHAYSWYVSTTDGIGSSPTSGLGTSSNPCNFTYDPTAPGQPGLQEPSGSLILGGQATVTLAPCMDALASPPVTCTGTAPTRYVYQVNETAALSVTATGGIQTLTIPLHHVGPNLLTVYGLSAGGNPGAIASVTFSVDGPPTPYPDGDINGDTNPDFITNHAGNAGLWLATSNGHGALTSPIDIGALGTGLNSPGTPADWNGAQILHGDFTGNHAQDTVAYYPNTGNAMLLFGNGDTTPLSPYVGDQQRISAPHLADTHINPDGDNPTQLVAAGNASLQGNPLPDMIAIAGDATNGYELDLETNTIGLFGDYRYNEPLAGPKQTPDGTGWENYALATAQPNGQTVLFALNTTNGKLYESTNPNQSSDALIGTPGSWTTAPLSVPWTSTPQLVSADINATGNIELWTGSGFSATAYTLTGTTVAQEATNDLLGPTHEWPLADGDTATAATDSRGGAPVQLSPTGTEWQPDGYLQRPVISLDGASGYLQPPNGLIQASTSLTVSLSFQAQPGKTGILFSTGHDAPSALNTATMPVMYIGTDERLYAQFWNGYIRPMVSPERVDDDQWHTVTLTADGYDQSLFLDDDLRIGMAGSPLIKNEDPQNFIGAGVFPANTSSKTWVNAPGTTTQDRVSYFTGKIANVVYYNQYLTVPQVAQYNVPKAITGTITSQLSSGLCIDNKGSSTTNGNAIQIYTCNGSGAQQWTITPDSSDLDYTISIGDPANNGSCLAVSGTHTTNSTPIILWKCIPTDPAQKWHIESDGQLWNPNSGRCLADPGSSLTPGTQLIIYDCDYANEQNWHTP